ncbi:MAG TPA: hypothetical protein VK126_04825 [Nitrososphaerales archaeon]|nr:hypothetical protein [Nitrososphaerales archaeon]
MKIIMVRVRTTVWARVKRMMGSVISVASSIGLLAGLASGLF